MTTLADLFPTGPRADVTDVVEREGQYTMHRLTELIGDPREEIDTTRAPSSTHRLVQMVDAAVQDAAPTPATAVKPPRTIRRRRRPVDLLSVAAGALAVVSVVTAAAVGGVQMATASPAASALESLRQDEASLENAHQSLVTAHERLGADITQAQADATALRSTIEQASSVLDPAFVEEGVEPDPEAPRVQILDEAAIGALFAATETYTAGLGGITLPELPGAYQRGEIDEDSLAEVAAAIDEAQAQLASIDGVMSQVRDARTQFEALRAPYDQALSTFAGTVPAAAARVFEQAPDAETELRDAVTAAAARIAASGVAGADGAAALTAYRDAVAAVLADQLRVDRERAAAEEEERRRNEQQQPQPQPDPEPEPEPEPQPSPEPTMPTLPGPPPGETPPEGEGTP